MAAAPRGMTGPGELQRVYSDASHSVALHGNTVLSFSLDPPNPRYLDAWIRAVDRMVADGRVPIAVVTIIHSGARAPDEPSKQAIRATIGRHATHIAAFAYVVEGRGFSAAAVRSALSIIGLAARYPFPQKVFADIPEAIHWTSSRLPAQGVGRGGAAATVSAVEKMRQDVHHLAAVG